MAPKAPNLNELLCVGCAGIIQVDAERKDSPRYKTVVRGWQQGSIIMLDVPEQDGTPLYVKRRSLCTVRFFTEGMVCAFNTVVVESARNGQNFFLVTWPSEVDVARVRKHERIELNLPAAIGTATGKIAVELCDLSIGGAGLLCPYQIAVKSEVTLNFVLPDGSIVRDAPAVVCTSQPRRNGAFVGVAFTQAEDTTEVDFQDAIEFFLTTTMDRKRLAHEMPDRLLFIGDTRAGLGTVLNALEEKRYDVATAACAVDGFFRLRSYMPRVLFVNEEGADLPGMEVCRLVRATQGLQWLPIVLYGGSGDLAKAAKRAGATAYLPQLTPDDAFFKLVADLADTNEQILGVEKPGATEQSPPENSGPAPLQAPGQATA